MCALQVHAAACALVVRLALRALSLPRAVRAARAMGSLCRTRASAADCLDAAETHARRFAHGTCLYRALTAYALLAHRHPLARFHIGATTTGERSAHAWVSVGDLVLRP